MNLRSILRVANGIFWFWMWFSAAMMPVTSSADDFWSVKVSQLFSLNPNIQDIPRFIGNALLKLMLWLAFDRLLKPKKKAKTKSNL